MSGYSSAPIPPRAFEKAIVLIDGTNLFYRLEAAKLKLQTRLEKILAQRLDRRQLLRIYLYTIEQHLTRAQSTHPPGFLDGIRIKFGEGIPTADGNVREKGVDALLVADLIYHAAVRNAQYALLVSTDTDFVLALQRAEDFGCRTGVLSVCTALPARLRQACDDSFELCREEMIQNQWVVPV